MSLFQAHDCDESAVETVSTAAKPYHYVGSGLGNVYLVGVKYWLCSICGKQAAEIPQMDQLLKSIARTLVEKQSPLIGEQVRFLRKRIGVQSKMFAAWVGITPERYSALEAKSTPLAEGRDKLFRMVYTVFSRDSKLKKALTHAKQIQEWLLAIHGRGHSERIIGTWLGKQAQKWRVETMAAAA